MQAADGHRFPLMALEGEGTPQEVSEIQVGCAFQQQRPSLTADAG